MKSNQKALSKKIRTRFWVLIIPVVLGFIAGWFVVNRAQRSYKKHPTMNPTTGPHKQPSTSIAAAHYFLPFGIY